MTLGSGIAVGATGGGMWLCIHDLLLRLPPENPASFCALMVGLGITFAVCLLSRRV